MAQLKKSILVSIVILLVLSIHFICNAAPPSTTIKPASSLPPTMPWDLIALSKSPTFQWLDKESPVHSLLFQGEPYNAKPTKVFAYYATPATLSDKESTGKHYPAVVLVHGGGGTAFKEWVELWAKRGYAAIAMDLYGCGQGREKLPDGGPALNDNTVFGKFDLPIKDNWPYHAVANVILAHSLIRSFDEVDANKTAITGISWGGYLTCIVSGLDNRFSAAVPVYGCGYLYENSAWLHYFNKMTEQQKTKWISLWDPSQYIGSAAMPIFFVNGTNDHFYPLDSYAKTYKLVKTNCNYRITVNMPHGHPSGWAPNEIGLYIDHYLKGTPTLPVIAMPTINDGKIHAEIKTGLPIKSASLHYTTDKNPINKHEWITTAATIDDNHVLAPAPPESAAIWFLTVTDDRGAIVSSKIVFAKEQ